MVREWESLNAKAELARMHRDGHCHEAVFWYVHHLPETMLSDTAVSSPSWVLTLRFLLLTSVWYVRCGIGSLGPAWHTADGQTGHRGSSLAEFDLRAPCRKHPHLSSNASVAQKCFSRHRVQIDWSRNRFRNLTFELSDGNKQSHAGRELPVTKRATTQRPITQRGRLGPRAGNPKRQMP